LRVGGRLAQLATPGQLLSKPVDAFVAAFVGRDRGYRALGFTPAGELATHDEPTIAMGSALAGAEAADGWLLAVDDQGAPQGWLRLADLAADRAGQATVTEDLLHRGGTVAGQDGSLRSFLDACLSSPSGRGVIVDRTGRLAGTVTAAEVLAAIEQRSAAGQPVEQPVGGGGQ